MRLSQILIFASALACASGAAFFASSALVTPGETPFIGMDTGTPTRSTLIGGQLSSQNCMFVSQCTGNARAPGLSARHSVTTISLIPNFIKAMLPALTAFFN